MKKINKLQINAEKLMKNEELVTLRGGYGGASWLVRKVQKLGVHLVGCCAV